MPSDYSGAVRIGRPLTRREAAVVEACIRLAAGGPSPAARGALQSLAVTVDELAAISAHVRSLAPPEAEAPSDVAVGTLVEVVSGNGAGSRGRVTHVGAPRVSCPKGHALGHECRRVHLGAWWTTLCNVRPVPEP